MENSDPFEYLSGTGIVSNLISKNDWDQTVLGKANSWPQSLHTSLGLLFNFQLPMFLIWGKHHVTFFNDAALIFFREQGIDKEFLGKPCHEILPQHWEKILPALNQVQSTGKGTSHNSMVFPHYSNGEKKAVSCSLSFSPVFEKNAIPEGVLVICRENLGEKTEKIDESERKVRAIVNNTPFPLALQVGKEMKIELANKAIIDIWGKGKDIIGMSLKEVLPELENQKILAELDQVYETGIPFHRKNKKVELNVDGAPHTYFLNYSFMPIFDKHGAVYGVMHAGADVTDLNNTRNKIAESEQRFRMVADNAPVMIWMSGRDKKCNFFNKAWLNFTGKPLEKEYGHGWSEGVHTRDLQKCLDIFHKSFDQRKAFYMEYRLKRHDGAYRWISDSAVPRFTPDGIFEGYIGACMDIHEQVMFHEKLKEEEGKLNLVVQASELGVVDLDLISRNVHYSSRFLEILGYPKEVNLSYKELLDHVHPDDLKMRNQVLKKAYKTGKINFSLRLIWKDGSIHWIEALGRAFFDEKNKPLKIITTIRDITEEKISQQQLVESEQKFRLLADSINQHIWTFDPEGKLTYINQNVIRYSGLSPEDLYNEGWINIIHPDDKEENIKLWNASINSGRDFIYDHRLLRKDGAYRWHTCRAIPQRDCNGKIQMWVCTSTDIHDQRKFVNDLEKQVSLRTSELEDKNRELVRINEELASFAYISSHDLQEPLRKIQTFSSLIMEREFDNLTDEGRNNFQRMINSANRMQNLIQDLLTYSQTTTGEKNFEKVDLSDIVQDVKEELKEEISRKKAKLEVEGLCDLYIIPFQIRQLFYNLLSNSLKFNHPDRQLEIYIDCKEGKGGEFDLEELSKDLTYFNIQVRDNGIGFDPQYENKVFDVFQRFHSKSQYNGTGIGLAIVKKIVENHNGVIKSKGQLNKGAIFDIYLPKE